MVPMVPAPPLSPREHDFSPAFVKAIVIAACILPVAVALCVMVSNWVPVPYWDEWKTPGEQIASYYRGTLTWQELCSQHNESRKLFPRLVYLPVAIAAGWDVRWLMALSFGFVCAGSALLYKLARRTCASPAATFCCFATMNAWLFWPRQYENFLLGIQGELFVPGFAIAAACLINLSARPLWMKAVANAALAHISTYTVANGMLVWLLAFPMEAQLPAAVNDRTRRIWWKIMYVAAAMTSIGCYFRGYQHPALSPPFVFSVRRWPELAEFEAHWLGDITLVGSPMLGGAVVTFLFASLAAFALWLCRRHGGWQRHYPWLLLGAYTLLSGSITAAGRLGFGLNSAAHFRYAPFTAFLYIAVTGLAASIYQQLGARAGAARAWRTGCAVGAVMIIALAVFGLVKERRIVKQTKAQRQQLLLAMRWSLAIPHNPDLALLTPYENTLETIRTLAEHDALRPRLIGAELARMVSTPPAPLSNGAGVLEQVQRGAKPGELQFKGWGYADRVVIGYETADGKWQLLTVVETRKKRRDVAAQFPDGPFARPKFSHSVPAVDLPPGENTFRAWGIDLAAERVWPLGGAVSLPNESR